ncbi:MAG: His/Gly/Thr/Pro-type tRNA ligase C-terminal domain-containing protein, partial [Janthinobacterium lividum]
EYAKNLHQILSKAGIRSELDISSEKVNYKIRNYSNKKIPIIGVIGKQEAASNTVSLRRLGSDVQEQMTIEELVLFITQENGKYLT